MARQAATEVPASSQDVARLEREVEQLHDDRDFLREQIKVKDAQIAVKDQQISAMLERDRETNGMSRVAINYDDPGPGPMWRSLASSPSWTEPHVRYRSRLRRGRATSRTDQSRKGNSRKSFSDSFSGTA
jgi:hypothetical protein